MEPKERSKKPLVKRPSDSPNCTKWKWDEREFWWRSYVDSNGENQFEYHPNQFEGGQTSNQQQIPRSTGPSVFTRSSEYTSPLGSPSGPSYITDGSPGAAYDANSGPRPEDTSEYTASDDPSSSYNTQATSKTMSEQANYYMQRPESSSSNASTLRSFATNAVGSSLSITPSLPKYEPNYMPADSRATALSRDLQGLSMTASDQVSASPSSGQNLYYSTSSNNSGELDTRYQSRENDKRFWKVGRVFKVLWTEPARDGLACDGPSTSTQASNLQLSTTYLGGQSYTEIRHFLILAVGHGNSICSPIHTYGGQATMKSSLPERQQHAIIYTSDQPPNSFWWNGAWVTTETEGLKKDPIKVILDKQNPDGDLGRTSRLNYSKVYTVEHYVRVLNIGMVDAASLHSLEANSFVKRRESKPEGPNRHRSHPSSSSKNDNKGKGKERQRDSGKRSSHR